MSKGAETQTDYKALREFGQRHITKGLGRISEGIMIQGEGSYVKYDDGRKMLDFTCGIGVTNLGKEYVPCHLRSDSLVGHAHERVSRAAAEQCMKLVHSQVRCACIHQYLGTNTRVACHVV